MKTRSHAVTPPCGVLRSCASFRLAGGLGISAPPLSRNRGIPRCPLTVTALDDCYVIQAVPIPLYAELKPPLDEEAARVEADRCLECGGHTHSHPAPPPAPRASTFPGFIGAIAAADGRRRARTDLRREPARRNLRARLPGRGALRGRMRARSTRANGRSRSARLQRYAADTALAGHWPLRASRRAERLPHRGGRRRPGRARMRRRTRRARPRRHGLRRAARARRPRPLRDRAVPPARRAAPAGDGSAARARRSPRARSPRRPRTSSRELVPGADAVVLAVGMGADSQVAPHGRRPRRGLGLAAVHRGDQDRPAAARRQARRCHRRWQHGRRRARSSPSVSAPSP